MLWIINTNKQLTHIKQLNEAKVSLGDMSVGLNIKKHKFKSASSLSNAQSTIILLSPVMLFPHKLKLVESKCNMSNNSLRFSKISTGLHLDVDWFLHEYDSSRGLNSLLNVFTLIEMNLLKMSLTDSFIIPFHWFSGLCLLLITNFYYEKHWHKTQSN